LRKVSLRLLVLISMFAFVAVPLTGFNAANAQEIERVPNAQLFPPLHPSYAIFQGDDGPWYYAAVNLSVFRLFGERVEGVTGDWTNFQTVTRVAFVPLADRTTWLWITPCDYGIVYATADGARWEDALGNGGIVFP
jgi:hypothetical protein